MGDSAVGRISDVNFEQECSGSTLGRFGEDPKKEVPFELSIYPDFLDHQVFEQIRSDVINTRVRLKPKHTDLYKFKQSKDLRTEIITKKLTPLLSSFIDVMLDKVRRKLEKKFDLKLSTKHFDITISRYDKSNYLLCHNDDMKYPKKNRRAIAFIYYLNSRPWTRDDGGALVLYDCDEAGEPVSINNYVGPKPNTLLVFRTSSRSWHSVEEVLCEDDVRLSLNGWFHIDDAPENPDDYKMATEPSLYKFVRPVALEDRTERFFKECVSSEYLMEKTCFLIRRKFKRKSEINLTNFLIREKFDEIGRALKEAVRDPKNLEQVGPYNKRNYKVLKVDKLPQICQDLYVAFRSELFFLFLSRLTGLDLQPPSFHLAGGPNDGAKNSSTDEDDDEDDEDDEDDDDSDEDEDDVDNLEDGESSGDDTKVDAAEIAKQKEVSETGNDQNILDKVPPKNAKTEEKHQSPSADVAVPSSSNQTPPRKRKKVSDPIARMEFRHLEAGSYTLIHDYSYELSEKSALDVILHFNHDFVVNYDDGGFITYLDGADDGNLHDMDCELLTIEPKSNCLSLAYRCDEETFRFLKYMTRSHKSSYQDLYCVYYERPDDLPRASDANEQSTGGTSDGKNDSREAIDQSN